MLPRILEATSRSTASHVDDNSDETDSLIPQHVHYGEQAWLDAPFPASGLY